MSDYDEAPMFEKGAAPTCVTIFRTRVRPEHREAYGHMAKKMHDLAVKAPGFISIKTFGSDDGERVSIVEFANREATAAWRDDALHLEAQRLGREQFYSEYRIQVCETLRDRSFSQAEAERGSTAG
jgi:heme-degrading monooxygenase HmoA